MLTGKVHSPEDKLLLSRLAEGSYEAFDKLYDLYWEHVVNEAYKRMGNRDHAKDIAQEVFTSLWIRGTDKPIENLPAWLYVVTRNNVYKVIQKQDRFVPIEELVGELTGLTDSADAAFTGKELQLSYERLIASLPDQQRIIYKMRYDDELNPDEIASELKLSPKTIRNHLGRALLKLKTTFMVSQVFLLGFLL